jgi:hypothetical protein
MTANFWTTEKPDVESRLEQGMYPLNKFSDCTLRPNESTTQCILGSLSPVVKRPDREYGHCFPPSAKAENARCIHHVRYKVVLN